MKQKFTQKIDKELGHYVYRLIDPRSGQTFYIGRGQGNRVFSHVNGALKLGKNEDDLSTKLGTIREINDAGLEVIHVICRHGMDKDSAAEVEAALIDATPGLTNEIHGQGYERGPAHVEELEKRYAKKVMVPKRKHKLVFIKIRQDTIDEKGSLYAAVRASWIVDRKKVEKADYILAIVEGVCRGMFTATAWKQSVGKGKRLEFDGDEVHNRAVTRTYVGKLIPPEMRKRGMAAPVLYKNYRQNRHIE